MRPASEIANEICGCANRDQHRRDIALIQRDRDELVREIAKSIRATMCDCSGRFVADEIERKYLAKGAATDE